MFYVLDTALRQADAAIAVHPPERGGALLGPRGRRFVTSFISDDAATTTHITFEPSRQLRDAVRELESQTGMEFKGLIHSHPGMDRPSGQDVEELSVGLTVNPHLGVYIAPIVTSGQFERADLGVHELCMPSGKLSMFVAVRGRDGAAVVQPEPVREVPLLRHLEALRERFPAASGVRTSMVEYAGHDVVAGSISVDETLEFIVLVTELYPDMPPVLLGATPDGTEQLAVEWPLQVPVDERLMRAVSSVIGSGRGMRPVYAANPDMPLSTDASKAGITGWRRCFASEEARAAAAALRSDRLSRTRGLLHEGLMQSSVLVAGAGSVGSYLAEQLVRSGVGAVHVVDHESVEVPNLSRTVYELRDIGRTKTAALARRLLEIDPRLRLRTTTQRIQDIDPSELRQAVAPTNLVVGATDDPAAQLRLSHFAYATGVPAVFVGLTPGAEGGEVILSLPERTPCYVCATTVRHSRPAALAPKVDYGVGRLTGEVALCVDIQHVASAAGKLALCLLSEQAGDGKLQELIAAPVAAEQSYLTMSMVPRYWFFPEVFGATPGQYAFQSVWLTPTRRPECPICGESDQRADPLVATAGAPSLGELRAAASAQS